MEACIIAFGMPNSRNALLHMGVTLANLLAIIEPNVGAGGLASFLWGVFLFLSFLYLKCFVPEDSHCHMGGSDVVNAYWRVKDLGSGSHISLFLGMD